MSTNPVTPDKTTTIATTVEGVLAVLGPLAASLSGAKLAEPILDGVKVAIAALENLIKNHNVQITYGDLENMRLKTDWPDSAQQS